MILDLEELELIYVSSGLSACETIRYSDGERDQGMILKASTVQISCNLASCSEDV